MRARTLPVQRRRYRSGSGRGPATKTLQGLFRLPSSRRPLVAAPGSQRPRHATRIIPQTPEAMRSPQASNSSTRHAQSPFERRLHWYRHACPMATVSCTLRVKNPAAILPQVELLPTPCLNVDESCSRSGVAVPVTVVLWARSAPPQLAPEAAPSLSCQHPGLL